MTDRRQIIAAAQDGTATPQAMALAHAALTRQHPAEALEAALQCIQPARHPTALRIVTFVLTAFLRPGQLRMIAQQIGAIPRDYTQSQDAGRPLRINER